MTNPLLKSPMSGWSCQKGGRNTALACRTINATVAAEKRVHTLGFILAQCRVNISVGRPLTNTDVTIRVLTWTSSMGQLQKMLSTWPKSCMVMYRPLSQRKPSRMSRNVVQQTVTYVDMLQRKPSRMYRHVIKLTVTSHDKPSRMYRRVVQQTVTYVQTCRTANRHVCTNVSYSKPSRRYKSVVQQTVTYA